MLRVRCCRLPQTFSAGKGVDRRIQGWPDFCGGQTLRTLSLALRFEQGRSQLPAREGVVTKTPLIGAVANCNDPVTTLTLR